VGHSVSLFETLLDRFLPTLPPSSKNPTPEEWDIMAQRVEARKQRREQVVVTKELPRFGKQLEIVAEQERRIVFLTTLHGGHNRVAALEGVQDVMADVLGLN
jgi:hypothetical protein